ncbi:MAG: hypothetical protein ACI8U1_003147, partial [Rheinheimera aquimaris]
SAIPPATRILISSSDKRKHLIEKNHIVAKLLLWMLV